MKIKKKHKHNPSIKGKQIFSIATLIVTVLAHVAIVVLTVMSFKYYDLDKKAFLGIIAVVACLLLIVDLLFLVGFKYNDYKIKIVNFVLALLIVIGTSIGAYYIHNINASINNIIDNSGTDQYETIGGVFSYYKKNTKTYDSLDDLKSVNNLRIGFLYDDGVGTGSIAKTILENNDIKYEEVIFTKTDDLLSALVGEEENQKIEIAVFPSSYRQRLLSDENVDYEQYLNEIVDFYSFEEKVKTGENASANKDLASEPFNILLIGFAPEDEAMTYGLADSIIVATVNPQTYTVAMTSIARDSFVEITCYNNARDKINAARGTSRQCLMDTVGQLLDLEINYYMEVNFLGVVQIVDAIGGIVVNNPVTFVGQTASGIRGNYTVWVPAGEDVPLNGEQALAFARERHAMPNGDFDRQQHQQEVITEIVRGLMELNDVNKALEVMKAAGDNMSTNLSLSQLTSVFNYLVKTKNYMGIPAFNMIDIQHMRITGYASWTYNYSMRLPLWIYKLYEGSIQEAKDRIADVLNDYDYKKIEQLGFLEFFAKFPYERGQLYSDYFNEQQVHEQLPAYYPYLTKYTYQQALAWAAANGVHLQVSFIEPGSAGYNASEDGWVVSQYPRQGALVSEWPNGQITVMGSGDPNYVPEYIVEGCNDQNSCRLFAEGKGISFSISYIYDDSRNEGDFAGANFNNGDTIKQSDTLIAYEYKHVEKVSVPAASGNYSTYGQTLESLGFSVQYSPYSVGANDGNNGSVIGVYNQNGESVSGATANKGSVLIVKYYSVLSCGENATFNSESGQCVCKEGYEGDASSGCTLKQPEPEPEPEPKPEPEPEPEPGPDEGGDESGE